MTTINDGGPAFPVTQQWDESVTAYLPRTNGDPHGMTLRDYFAAQAMPLCHYNFCSDVRAGLIEVPDDWQLGIAFDAYKLADAMLAARNAK